MNSHLQEVKLTKKQEIVIYALQNGFQLITDNSAPGALCCNEEVAFEVRSQVFWNLVTKDMIYQEMEWPFDYVLTDAGKKIKTREIEFILHSDYKK